MTLKPFAGLLTAAVMALMTTTASAQNFLNPATWFAPSQPCYGPICPPTGGYRAALPRPVYPNYAGPVNGGNYYRGNDRANCPDDICGPSNSGYRGDGRYVPAVPRYSAPVTPMPYNGRLAPAPTPTGWNNGPRMPHYDRRVAPVNYDDEWMVNRSPRNDRNYGPNNSPFYP